jgi:raffinose/stachyose/melibiose transport system substrate-binding protein
MKKAIVAVVSILIIALPLYAGGGNQSTSGGSRLPVVTFMSMHADDEVVVKYVNEKLAGELVVEFIYVPIDQLDNVLSTQLAAGEGPDVFWEGPMLMDTIRAGRVMEITGADYLAPFNQAGFSICSLNGKIYGVPSWGWFVGLWYNTEIFNKVGIKPHTTYDEFLANCEKLKAAGYAPITFGLLDSDSGCYSLFGFLESDFYHGQGPGTRFDADYAFGKVRMATTPQLVQAVDRWKLLIDRGYITRDMVGLSDEQSTAGFLSGKAAMKYGGPWNYNQFKEAGISLGMMPPPSSNPGDQWLLGGPSGSYVININSKNKEAAQKVLRCFASREAQQILLDENPGASVYYSGLNPDMPPEYDGIKPVLAKGNIGASWYRWNENFPGDPIYFETAKQLQLLVSGAITTRQFLEALDVKADSLRYKN